MGNTQFGVDWQERVDFSRLRQDRLRKVRDGMVDADLENLLLFKPQNIRYTASAKGIESYWDISECALISLDNEPFVYLSPGVVLDAPWLEGRIRAPKHLSGDDKDGVNIVHEFACEIRELVGSGKNTTLGIDVLNPALYEQLSQAGFEIRAAGPALGLARETKTADEISLLKVAAAMNDAAFQSCHELIKPGVRENDVTAAMIYTLRKLGSDWQIRGVACSGEHTSPQYKTVGGTDRIIQPGDLVLIDMVHSYMSYWSDVARTIICGKPRENQTEIYQHCYEMLLSGIEWVRPGNSTSDVINCWDKLQDSKIQSFGVGHGIGTTLHEVPIIDHGSIKAPVEFRPGMVLALEVYASSGKHGVRLEENIEITESGYNVINRFPFDDTLL